jgi:alkanesulfonate monooxygenase SsuD/methylene tetrahydromethanopterin reductase-like flavin-dependent oxidoreductase (luciferase family)
VTSVQDAEAQNFGRGAHYGHAERYESAREFSEVVKGLWDSWEDDAFLRDVESGLYFDRDKLHILDQKSKHFSVKGPLNVPRLIQGHPVIVQAGASKAGTKLAAEYAEVVFCSSNSIKVAQEYYANFKDRMEKFGHSPDDLKVLPGLSPVVAATMSEAEEEIDEMQLMIDPVVTKEILATVLGMSIYQNMIWIIRCRNSLKPMPAKVQLTS